MSDPKTAAFAKAAQAVSDEMAIAVFSESEGEEEEGAEDAKAETKQEDDYEKSTPSVYTKRVIIEEEEEEEEDDDEEDQEMKDVSDDENLLIVVSTPNKRTWTSYLPIWTGWIWYHNFSIERIASNSRWPCKQHSHH